MRQVITNSKTLKFPIEKNTRNNFADVNMHGLFALRSMRVGKEKREKTMKEFDLVLQNIGITSSKTAAPDVSKWNVDPAFFHRTYLEAFNCYFIGEFRAVIVFI